MATTTAPQIEQEIQELENQLAARKALLESLNKNTPIQELAVALHTATCRWNHTDGCSWEYEIHNKTVNWTGYAHQDYFTKAVNLNQLNPEVDVTKLTQIIRTLKEV